MESTVLIENENVEQFKSLLREFDLEDNLSEVNELDFRTNFHFVMLESDQEDLVNSLSENLTKNH